MLVLSGCNKKSEKKDDEENTESPRKVIDHTKELEEIDKIIPADTPRKVKHPKPNVAIIIDQFSMRKDISNTILEKLSPNVILCVPCYSINFNDMVKKAKDFNFNLAISIDTLNLRQWANIQKFIETHQWVKGVVVWEVSTKENLRETLEKAKKWLASRSIWLLYANTNNILPNRDVPVGVFMPDGFVRTTDQSQHCNDQADFVLSQAKFTNRGLLLVEPGTQHVAPLVDWIQKNINNIKFDNLSK